MLKLLIDKIIEMIKKFILYVVKGKYFRNDIVSNKLLDIDIDGLIYLFIMN